VQIYTSSLAKLSSGYKVKTASLPCMILDSVVLFSSGSATYML